MLKGSAYTLGLQLLLSSISASASNGWLKEPAQDNTIDKGFASDGSVPIEKNDKGITSASNSAEINMQMKKKEYREFRNYYDGKMIKILFDQSHRLRRALPFQPIFRQCQNRHR